MWLHAKSLVSIYYKSRRKTVAVVSASSEVTVIFLFGLKKTLMRKQEFCECLPDLHTKDRSSIPVDVWCSLVFPMLSRSCWCCVVSRLGEAVPCAFLSLTYRTYRVLCGDVTSSFITPHGQLSADGKMEVVTWGPAGGYGYH